MTSDAQANEQRPYWFVGAQYGGTDHTERFLRDSVWDASEDSNNRDRALVKAIHPGDRIAIKAAFRRKHNLPFDYQGKTASCMSIKAVGTVRENLGDGLRIRVDWSPESPPRTWYFYTNRYTVWKVQPGEGTLPWAAEALIRFTFEGEEQDYPRFLATWNVEGWGQLVERARQYIESGHVYEIEVKYKLEIADKLASIRKQVLSDAPMTDEVARQLRGALVGTTGGLVHFLSAVRFYERLMEQREDTRPDSAPNALRALWDPSWGISDGFQLLAKHLELADVDRASRVNLIIRPAHGHRRQRIPAVSSYPAKLGIRSSRLPET